MLLFEPDNGARDPWDELSREMDRAEARSSLLAFWRQSYEAWKRLYRQFREAEHFSLYAEKAGGRVPHQDEGMLRRHRVAIATLMERGERLAELLDSVAAISSTREEKDEASDCKMRIGTLLEALRESLSLWHPANKQAPKSLESLHKLFA